MESSQKVVTRFAPSPTGKAHAGSYRTAMYAWLYARKHKGTFILRIEDTDTARNDKASELDIYEALEWLGLDYDKKYIQSEHVARHKQILQTLIDTGHAYVSREEAKDGSGVIKDIVRFKNPNKVVTFHDEIRGSISTDTTDLGDFVIARNMDEPLYHLAVIVDDHDEGVTHVIRAEEHIPNTPRQILLIEALGWQHPVYAHIPIVLGPDKQKLSKRKGALAMTAYAGEGYLRDAVFNAIAMIGWNPADPGSTQELFTVPELIERFDFGRVQKSGAVFSVDKLNWFNREYIKMLSSEDFVTHAKIFAPSWVDAAMLVSVEAMLRERIDKFADVTAFFEEHEYLFKDPVVDETILVWKNDTLENAKTHIAKAREILSTVEEWDVDTIKSALMPYAEEVGKGNVLWPVRVALSGKEKSPDPFEIASILGKEKTLARLSL
jgi:glutamyl-tRNA synthetase